MNWFLHNAIADLYGPYFLLFYATAILMLIVAACRSIRAVDRSRDLGPPEIPAKLDPYEVAYLRGGENEVTRVAIASLVQRGLLRTSSARAETGRSTAAGRPSPASSCRSRRRSGAGRVTLPILGSSSRPGALVPGRGGLRTV